MLSRLLPKPSHLRVLTYLSSKSQPCPPTRTLPSSPLLTLSKFLSTGRGNNGDGDGDRSRSASSVWNLSRDTDGKFDQFFADTEAKVGGGDEWLNPAEETAEEEQKPWNLAEEEVKDDVFDIGESVGTGGKSGGEVMASAVEEKVLSEEEVKKLEMEEKELSVILKGNFFVIKIIFLYIIWCITITFD